MLSSASLPRLGSAGSGNGGLLQPLASPRSSSSSSQRSNVSTDSVPKSESIESSSVHKQQPTQHRQSALLRRLSSAFSLQELEQDREKKATSVWVSRYQEQAKCELVNVDIAPLMDRFESVSLYHKPQRKPLNVALQEMATTSSRGSAQGSAATNQSRLSSHPSVRSLQSQDQHPILQRHKTLKRQATKVILKRRGADQQTSTDSKSGTSTASTSNTRARIVPTRFLYDATRWKQSSRCDYCNFAGGDLECATCDVIAHARCYLSAYESSAKKTKGAFVVPTRFSWLCCHCQQSLQQEYDERSKHARMQHIAMQRHIFGKVVTAYVRMTKDAMVFQTKKKAIIKIQAAFRGRLARQRFDRIQRMCLKPYAVDCIKVRGFNGDGGGSSVMTATSMEDLRLSNGFTCNPYVYVSVVDGKDDENQLFCFETSLRKGVSVQDTEVCWSDRLFVPGVDGNITLCFTLLSKNGPNNFFLGQAVLRLRDSDVIWRSGLTTELVLMEEVEIFPKTTQHQLLRLVEITGGGSSLSHNAASYKQQKRGVAREQHALNGLFANSSSSSFASSLTLSVHVKPFSDVHSYCGYMGMKNTLDSFQTSSRWCVLADGVLRIYRHFGVTLASDVIDMARTLEIKLVESSKVTNNGVFHREQNCLVIQHVSRLYLLQCDQKAANKLWLKKLQAATKFGASAGGGDQSSSFSPSPQNSHNNTSQ